MKPRTSLLPLLSLLAAVLLAGVPFTAHAAPPPAVAPAPAPAAAPAPASTAAVPASVAGAPLDAHMPFDPAITVGHLKNGLTYYIRKNTRPAERAELWLVVNAGSVLEDPDQLGLAHFIEHLAFASTVHFPKREIVRYLESIGMRFGPDINAQTDFDETVYTLRVPTDRPEIVDKAFDILEDWAHGMAFDPEEVERERGIVIAEWRDGRGAAARIGDRQLPTLLQGSRYAERLPIGTEETLQHASREAIQRFYRDWYRPDLMAVVAVGDFDKARIEALVEKHFAGIPAPIHPRPRPDFPMPNHKETRFTIVTDPEATTTVVGVFSQHPATYQDSLADYRRSLVETLYHDLLSARLSELSQAPDPPFLFSNSSSTLLVRSSRVSSETVGVQQGGVSRGLTALLTEVERVRRFGFTESELLRARQSVLREYEQAAVEKDTLESSSFAAEYQRNFTEGEPSPGIEYERALVRRFLPEIKLGEINRLSEQWNAEGNRVILVAAPEKEGTAPPKEAELRAVFAAVAASRIEPWVDRVRSGPLLAEKPKPGKVVAESRIADLGVTEWRLANGVRVVMKPTDFKKNEILFVGSSPGGLSRVSDADYVSGQFAAELLREGGLGAFDQVTLAKALAGKSVGATAFVGDWEQGISGGAAPQDLETMMQLIYLSLTAPRKDEKAFQSFITKMSAMVENRLARPEAVFQDKLVEAYTQGQSRRRPMTPELLAQIDLDTAYRIYRERFANASGMTFVFVGNFTPATMRPLVETYLGGLPGTGQKESWRDLAGDPPKGVVRVEVAKGIEPKSRVELAFVGDAKFSRESLYDVNALASVLEVRLRDLLRQDLGAVYDVDVSGDMIDRPRQRYTVTVGFGCAPERVDSLVATVFAEIEKVKASGVGEAYLKEVREAERRERQVDAKENRFWLDSLAFFYTEGFDPRGLLHFDDMVNRITADRVAASAREFLKSDRYVLGILSPEPGVLEPAAKPAVTPTAGR